MRLSMITSLPFSFSGIGRDMGIGGPDCEVHFSTGFLRLSPLLQLAVITYIFLRHLTGGEGVVGLDVTFFQQLIDSEITELRALSSNSRESRAPVQLDQQSVGRLSRMDAMQQQSMDVAREERRQARLAALASARRWIDSDDYGYCLGCGEEIAEARLKIDPAVTLCVDCQALRQP